MRMLCPCFRLLGLCLLVIGLPSFSSGADKPGNVVLQYHFVGASKLATDTNVGPARRVFALRSTIGFEEVVFEQLTTNLVNALHLPNNATTISALRPLFDDAVRVESLGDMGGTPGQPINALFAFHLGAKKLQLWQDAIKKADQAPGEAFQAESFTGWQWNKGASDSFWMVPARDWIVMGRGQALAALRSDYLQQIQKTGRPAPALSFNCFEGDVDWPRMTNWFSMDFCPLKLARAKMAVSSQQRRFDMVGTITYDDPIEWHPQPTIFPTNLVHEPLLSFATGQDVEPFLKSDETLTRLCTNPFRDQFYFWSMGELAFQSYFAWPVSNPSNTMLTLSAQAIDEFNPQLEALNGTVLSWMPKGMRLLWANVQLIAPSLHAAAPTNGPFLVASLFPPVPGKGPAPQALWRHIDGRTNLVFYDWELTGPRVRHLLTITQILPIFRMLDIGPREPFKVETPPAKPGAKTPPAPVVDSRQTAQEVWLANLAPFLPNTATEVTLTGPKELTVIRNSPFVFNSLELILLSHWLSDTPAGPLDWNLLPQAKMSGTGVAPSAPH